MSLERTKFVLDIRIIFRRGHRGGVPHIPLTGSLIETTQAIRTPLNLGT